jgi:hypothetical protein
MNKANQKELKKKVKQDKVQKKKEDKKEFKEKKERDKFMKKGEFQYVITIIYFNHFQFLFLTF